MTFGTLQDWAGAWKELKQWCLHKVEGIPDGIKEAGVWYDTHSQQPMWFDGTKARMFGVSNHNDLSLIDGGDPTFRGHTTSVQAGYLNNAGSANGVALLDSNGYLPIGNIPASLLGAVRYQGTWNPSTNTPTLVTPPSSVTKGYYYVASAVGTWDGKTFAIGDWIISNGTAWERVDNVDAISSVFGRTGAVVAQSGDYTAAQVTNTPSGNISATTVQAALNELDSEKLAATTAASTYAPINATLADNAASTTLPTAGTATAVVTLLQSIRDNLKSLFAKLTDGSVTKIGTATVGSTSKPIYLNAGTPTAISSTVGSATQPVYLNAGTVTAITGSIANATTGNAATATKLETARTITVDSSDMTAAAVSFDGSANITLAPTLDATGVTAGTYTKVTVDAKGRVTSGANPTTLAGYGITDGVASVFGRTGAVTAQSGDYAAAQVTNTPSGNISATTVQAALNELDSEKLAATTAASTYATLASVSKLAKGTCATAQATAAKDVVLANYVLTQGDIIEVLFTNASVASATLNVNGTGAKAIYDGGGVTSTGSWGATQLVGLMYDGAYWHILWVKSSSGIGNISDRTLATRFNVVENTTGSSDFALAWSYGTTLFTTTNKLKFNPSTGLLQATKVGVIGGASDGFMKANGSIDSTAYAPLSSVPSIDSVPTDGSMNAVSSGGVFDAIASLQPKHSTYATSDRENAGWISGITVRIPKTLQYINGQSIFNVQCIGGLSSAYQWTARVMLSIKIQDYSPSYKLVILDGDNYIGRVYGRYDQDTDYHYFAPEFYICPWGHTVVELERGNLPETFAGTYVPSLPSYAVAATVYDNYLESNTGTYGGVKLRDDGSADKRGYRGLSIGGYKRYVLMSHLSTDYGGLYNESDSKWLVLSQPDGTLVTDYTPPISSDGNHIPTTAWVRALIKPSSGGTLYNSMTLNPSNQGLVYAIGASGITITLNTSPAAGMVVYFSIDASCQGSPFYLTYPHAVSGSIRTNSIAANYGDGTNGTKFVKCERGGNGWVILY